MTNNAVRSEQAINKYVHDSRPEADHQIWRSQNPKSSWGMDSDTWFGVGKTIIRIFNDTHPTEIQINPNDSAVERAIKNLHDKVLPEYERYLALKGDSLTIQAKAISAMQASQIAVWEFEE